MVKSIRRMPIISSIFYFIPVLTMEMSRFDEDDTVEEQLEDTSDEIRYWEEESVEAAFALRSLRMRLPLTRLVNRLLGPMRRKRNEMRQEIRLLLDEIDESLTEERTAVAGLMVETEGEDPQSHADAHLTRRLQLHLKSTLIARMERHRRLLMGLMREV